MKLYAKRVNKNYLVCNEENGLFLSINGKSLVTLCGTKKDANETIQNDVIPYLMASEKSPIWKQVD